HRVEARPPVGVGEDTALVESRCSGMAGLQTRPEDAVLDLDALPCHAVVVGGPTVGRDLHLVEDLPGGVEVEVAAPAETVRDVDDDLPIAAGVAGRVDRGVDLDGAPLDRRG